MFGIELKTSSRPPPNDGACFCRHRESAICGELHCMIVDGGASAQLGMRRHVTK